MSKLRMSVVFLMCFVAVGVAQESAPAQSKAPAGSQQAVRVPTSVMVGLTDHKVLPQYPKAALMKGTQGDVIFNIVVDESGAIVSSKLVSGDPALAAASKDALRQYHFRPYTVDGAPVRVESQLGFRFTAAPQGDAERGQVECMTTIP